MEKKISVSMDDDQVTYIEVDGVTYNDPDEIPDPQDRAKVSELLSRMERNYQREPWDDDIDAAFEADFQKEVREMRQKTSLVPKLIVSAFFLVAAILLVVTVLSGLQAARRMGKEVAASGQVVDLVERTSTTYTKKGEKQTQIYAHPVVKFALASGQPQQFELQEGTWPPAYHVGEAVTILYEPQHPEDARIKNSLGAFSLWLSPLITCVVGLIFGAVGLVILRQQRAPF